ncbi:MAG: lytic transglycosylase domain-containing protein [Bacillota bacterium]|nr:lytic transglycosylase domain-containing protein [Bacillota bacterium]
MKKLLIIIIAAAITVIAAYGYITNEMFPLSYRNNISRYAEEYGVEQALIAAVIKTESNFKPNAASGKGAKGLMQLTKDTLFWLYSKTPDLEEFDEEHLTDPEKNIRYGTLNLSLLISKYGDETTALAAYNAGQGRVDKWLTDSRYSKDGKTLISIPYDETDKYIKRVMLYKKIYKILYPDLKKNNLVVINKTI